MPAPLPETLDAIDRADLITVGPGSLYTSLITNLLVQGIPEALAQARGLRVYICNLMTQANESLGLTRLGAHRAHLRPHRRSDLRLRAGQHRAVFADDAGALRSRKRRAHHGGYRAHRGLGVRCIAGDFASEGNVVRHAAGRVTGALLALGQTVWLEKLKSSCFEDLTFFPIRQVLVRSNEQAEGLCRRL